MHNNSYESEKVLVRVVEGARLESVYRGNSIMGSNPILSAITNDNRELT